MAAEAAGEPLSVRSGQDWLDENHLWLGAN